MPVRRAPMTPGVNGRVGAARPTGAAVWTEDEARFRALVQHASDLIVVYEADFTMRYLSPAVEHILGWTAEELVGRAPFDLIHPDDLARLRSRLDWRAGSDAVTAPHLYRVRHRDGSWVWLEALSSNQLDNDEIRGLVVSCRDVTARIEAQAALAESEERYRALVEHAPVAIGVHQGGRIVFANPAAARLFGAAAVSELVGTRIFDLVHPDHREVVRNRMRTATVGPGGEPLEVTFARPDGEVIDLEVIVMPITYEGAPAVQVVLHDVTARRRAELELAHRATHDPLTNLPNRAALLDRLELAIARCRRRHSRFALLFCDVDRFKVVNDSLGHDVGDELLVALADHLRRALRPGDTVARFGGDEFVILCEDLTSASEATTIAERLQRSLRLPFDVDGQTMHVAISAGVVIGDARSEPRALLRDADAAMYRAKGAGGSRFVVFDVTMRTQAVRRLETEQALRRAIRDGSLEVRYQPEVDVRTRRIVGAEALVRWQHPVLGSLTPDHFLDVAEETGLIVPLGRHVLETACCEAAGWRARVPDGRAPWVAVNLSATELAQPDLVDVVGVILETTGLDAHRLCVEITEGSLVGDPAGVGRTLSRLRALGVQVALDDFGTGYSSLGYLKRFDLDFLKIDRAFTAGLSSATSDVAIVTAVAQLARALGMQVVAEGVETEQQLRVLAELGVELAQGWLFARPGSAADVMALVEADQG